MNQNNLRQQVMFLNMNKVSYKEMANLLGVNQSSFYSWVAGNYDFKEDVAERLQQCIDDVLLQKMPKGKLNKTVKNLLKLLEEYTFRDDEILVGLPEYDSNERYYVTNYGNVFSLCGNSWLKKTPQTDNDGYLYVDLYENGERTRKRVHQLVVQAFMPSLDLTGMEIHHLDQNKGNAQLSNLLPVSKEQHRLIHKHLKKFEKFLQEDSLNYAGSESAQDFS